MRILKHIFSNKTKLCFCLLYLLILLSWEARAQYGFEWHLVRLNTSIYRNPSFEKVINLRNGYIIAIGSGQSNDNSANSAFIVFDTLGIPKVHNEWILNTPSGIITSSLLNIIEGKDSNTFYAIGGTEATIVLYKLNSKYERLWTKRFINSRNTRTGGKYFSIDSLDNLTIQGIIEYKWLPNTKFIWTFPYLIKIDSAGNKLWESEMIPSDTFAQLQEGIFQFDNGNTLSFYSYAFEMLLFNRQVNRKDLFFYLHNKDGKVLKTGNIFPELGPTLQRMDTNFIPNSFSYYQTLDYSKELKEFAFLVRTDSVKYFIRANENLSIKYKQELPMNSEFKSIKYIPHNKGFLINTFIVTDTLLNIKRILPYNALKIDSFGRDAIAPICTYVSNSGSQFGFCGTQMVKTNLWPYPGEVSREGTVVVYDTNGIINKFIPTEQPNPTFIAVYPNPFRDSFTLQVQEKKWGYAVFNLSGQEISRASLSKIQTEVYLQAAAGIYLINIYDENGDVIGKFKLVKY